tara:strand:+ start:4440 stop:4988 length:549 start_codon:yes stop_codon:yes gene_type:complete
MSARLPDEVWVEFLSRVTAGRAGQSVCKDKDMPAWGTTWNKIHNDKDFERKYMNALASRGMLYADQLDEINRRVLSGEIDPQAARLVSDNFKWTAARLLPKVYGDKQQVDVTHEAGSSYLDLLQKVNSAAQLKHADVVEHKENTSDELRAREAKVNQISVNSNLPNKQANRRNKGKKLSTGN